jgi:multiple sugar transport system substrate-binding protein
MVGFLFCFVFFWFLANFCSPDQLCTIIWCLDFGSCIGRGKGYQAFWWPWTVYGPYIQSRGTADGAFFDLNTMQPLVKNEGFAKAMTIYKNLMAVGPSNELSLGVSETRELFSQGRCAMTLDWAVRIA